MSRVWLYKKANMDYSKPDHSAIAWNMHHAGDNYAPAQQTPTAPQPQPQQPQQQGTNPMWGLMAGGAALAAIPLMMKPSLMHGIGKGVRGLQRMGDISDAARRYKEHMTRAKWYKPWTWGDYFDAIGAAKDLETHANYIEHGNQQPTQPKQ